MMNQQKNQATTMPKANRNYKDTLFRMIFRDEEKLLNLFNAVNRTQYTDVRYIAKVREYAAEYDINTQR